MTGSNKQKVFLSDEWSKFTRPGYTVEKKKIYLGVPNNETEILNSYSPLYGTENGIKKVIKGEKGWWKVVENLYGVKVHYNGQCKD